MVSTMFIDAKKIAEILSIKIICINAQTTFIEIQKQNKNKTRNNTM